MNENDLLDINIVCKMLNTTSRALRFYEEKGIIYPLHNNKFDVDEEAISYGVLIQTLSTINYLNK